MRLLLPAGKIVKEWRLIARNRSRAPARKAGSMIPAGVGPVREPPARKDARWWPSSGPSGPIDCGPRRQSCEKINNLTQRRQGAKTRKEQLLCFLCAFYDFAPLREILLLIQGLFHSWGKCSDRGGLDVQSKLVRMGK